MTGSDRRWAGRPLVGWALAVGVAISIALPTALALTQAPSGDELLTLAQAQDPTLETWRQTYAHPSPPPAPPAYYLVAWAAGRVSDDPAVVLRGLSIAGWAVASGCLGLVVRRHGGGPAAVLVATVLPSASGLLSQGMVARPYGLAVGALGVAVAAWERSLRGGHAHLLAIVVGAAVASAVGLHYATATVAPCLVGAELVARSRGPRPRSMLVAPAAAAVPILLAAGSVGATFDVERSQVHPVEWWYLASWYGSVLRPLLFPALALSAAVLIGLVVRAARSRSVGVGEGAGGVAALAFAPRDLVRSPAVVLALLLAATVPAAVVVVAWTTRSAYLHRYGIAGLLGVALLLAGVVVVAERGTPLLAVGATAAVLAGLPFAYRSASSEAPTNRQVASIARATGVDAYEGPVVTPEPYVYALLRWVGPEAVADRLVLAGPSGVPGEHPRFDLRAPAPAGVSTREVLLVADEDELARLVGSGRVDVVRRVGEARLRYTGQRRDLVGAVVRLVPASM